MLYATKPYYTVYQLLVLSFSPSALFQLSFLPLLPLLYLLHVRSSYLTSIESVTQLTSWDKQAGLLSIRREASPDCWPGRSQESGQSNSFFLIFRRISSIFGRRLQLAHAWRAYSSPFFPDSVKGVFGSRRDRCRQKSILFYFSTVVF